MDGLPEENFMAVTCGAKGEEAGRDPTEGSSNEGLQSGPSFLSL